MSPITFRIIFLLSTLTTVIPLILYFVRIKDQAKSNSVVLVWLGFSLILDIGIWMLINYKIPTFILNNSYSIGTFVLLSVFYYKILFEKKAKILFYSGSLIFSVGLSCFGINYGLYELNTNIWIISAVILIVYSFAYFFLVPSMTIDRYLNKNLFSNIFINGAFTLYLCASMTIYIFTDFVFTSLSPDETRAFWSIHNIVNIVKNLILALGFFVSGKRQAYISLQQLDSISSKTLKK
jgi:hypothetical protein